MSKTTTNLQVAEKNNPISKWKGCPSWRKNKNKKGESSREATPKLTTNLCGALQEKEPCIGQLEVAQVAEKNKEATIL